MPSVFTRIVNGEIPCYKVAEDQYHLAFLDINPNAKGHTLVIPKQEVDYIFDLSEEDYHRLFDFAKSVAAKLKRAVPCVRIGLAVVGLEVPHVHIHLIPLETVRDIGFEKKIAMSAEELKALAEHIAQA